MFQVQKGGLVKLYLGSPNTIPNLNLVQNKTSTKKKKFKEPVL
jgi:hypothetical protein